MSREETPFIRYTLYGLIIVAVIPAIGLVIYVRRRDWLRMIICLVLLAAVIFAVFKIDSGIVNTGAYGIPKDYY